VATSLCYGNSHGLWSGGTLQRDLWRERGIHVRAPGGVGSSFVGRLRFHGVRTEKKSMERFRHRAHDAVHSGPCSGAFLESHRRIEKMDRSWHRQFTAIGNCEVFLDTLPRLSLFARDQAVSFFFSRLAGDVSDHGVDLSGTRSWNDDNHRGDLVLYDTDKQKNSTD